MNLIGNENTGPSELIEVIAQIWNSLPEVIGADWHNFESQLLILLRELEASKEEYPVISEQILALFNRYPEAKKMFTSYSAEQKPISRSIPKPVTRRWRSGTSLSKRKGTTRTWKSSDSGEISKKLDTDQIEKYKRYISVPVFYATDRAETNSSKPAKRYSGERDECGELGFGIAEVSIPDDHRMGELEKPRFWKLQFRRDPEKHVVLLSVEKLEEDEFIKRSRARLLSSSDKDALIFIHGYKTSFEDATRRIAQITYDLGFKGLPLLYSWPSENMLHRYMVDEANITWTRTHFEQFTKMALTQLGAETVHVIAHSMGNRVLAEILKDFDPLELPDGSAKLRQIIFAAPDIDKDTFEDLAKKFSRKVDRYTLYASSKDIPLDLSNIGHKYQRAGDSHPEVTIAQSVDTIDASNVIASFLGHAYYGENRSVISDIFHLIRNGLPPAERGLNPCEINGKQYWEFRK